MIVRIKQATSWARAYWAALRTEGKDSKGKEPSDKWKKSMLLCEHSPVRTVEYDIEIESIRQWVTVHIVRHWLGFIPFVHSQRDDRRELSCPRDQLPQGARNDMAAAVNAQALINISRKRLCRKASKETREAWEAVHAQMQKVDPVMAGAMVPECVYRGFCPERQSCGWVNTEAYRKRVEEYRKTE